MSSTSLFIADLHLSPQQPETVQQFAWFVTHIAPSAQHLYILGDLFEYWLGDDILDLPANTPDNALMAYRQLARHVCQLLRQLSDTGTQLWLQHGNRDFLLQQTFCQRCHMTLLPDIAPIDLCGTPSLLLHGDTLCTDDIAYQRFRAQVRNPAWQQQFLVQSLASRAILATSARQQSMAATHEKSDAIMDVSPQSVAALLREHHYPRLIHGHTHRPAHHTFTVDDHLCERWVLPDWHGSRSGYLRCDEQGCAMLNLSSVMSAPTP